MSAIIFCGVIALLALWGAVFAVRIEKRFPPAGHFVPVDGGVIHLVDYGNPDPLLPPVVLIHGASANLRDMQVSLGEALATSRRVILVDRPGRGYSTRPDDGWRLDVQSRMIRDALKARGVVRPLIVGQSFGGAVALNYAVNYQDEISGLVFLAGVAHEWPAGPAWYNRVSGWPAAGFLLRRLIIPAVGPLLAQAGVVSAFAPDAPRPDYIEATALNLLFRPGDFRANAADIRHLKAEVMAMAGRYRTLSLPVLIMTGDADTVVSPNLHSLAIAKEIQGANLVIFERTGHALHHSRTAEIASAINEFPVKIAEPLRQPAGN